MSHLICVTLVGALTFMGGCMLGKDKKFVSAALIYIAGILVGHLLF